ncbi:MAG TPA: ABC transporter substrate-binding protein [Thermoanaerobaculia bacterium]|nr:ABC transporter substrate-binding protein [Thermoanaerobaculia bacterium]
MDKVRIQWMPFLSYGPLMIAEAEGFFEEEGIQIERIALNNRDGLTALLIGEIDVNIGFLTAGTINAAARGERIRIVADKGYEDAEHCAANALMASPEILADGQVTEQELSGAVFAARPASTHEFLVEKALAQHAMGITDVKLIDPPSPSYGEMITSGSVQFAACPEPMVTRMLESETAGVWKRYAEISPGLQWSMLFFGSRLLDREPELGFRFLRAYLRGVRAYGQGKTRRNVAVLSADTSLEPDLVERACWAAIRKDGTVNLENIQEFIDWAGSRGYLESAPRAVELWAPEQVNRAFTELRPAD